MLQYFSRLLYSSAERWDVDLGFGGSKNFLLDSLAKVRAQRAKRTHLYWQREKLFRACWLGRCQQQVHLCWHHKGRKEWMDDTVKHPQPQLFAHPLASSRLLARPQDSLVTLYLRNFCILSGFLIASRTRSKVAAEHRDLQSEAHHLSVNNVLCFLLKNVLTHHLSL